MWVCGANGSDNAGLVGDSVLIGMSDPFLGDLGGLGEVWLGQWALWEYKIDMEVVKRIRKGGSKGSDDVMWSTHPASGLAF